MPTIAATEFKAKCLNILDDVKRTRREVIITKRGKPVARLVPMGKAIEKSSFGRMKGTIKIVGDIFSTGERWQVDV